MWRNGIAFISPVEQFSHGNIDRMNDVAVIQATTNHFPHSILPRHDLSCNPNISHIHFNGNYTKTNEMNLRRAHASHLYKRFRPQISVASSTSTLTKRHFISSLIYFYFLSFISNRMRLFLYVIRSNFKRSNRFGAFERAKIYTLIYIYCI